MERQREYEEFCTLAEEIDFQGLLEYIDDKFLDLINKRLFSLNKKERGMAREKIINGAIEWSKANTKQARFRVIKFIDNCLEIIRGFYKSKISKKEYLIASESVAAVCDAIKQSTESSNQVIIDKIESAKNDLQNASLVSLDKAALLARTGNYSEIESELCAAMKHISVEHPMYPDFGFSFAGGILRSEPQNREAEKRFPARYVFNGSVRFGDTYYNDPNGNPLEYAYRHQVSFIIEVAKAVKYLGDRQDPIQTEAEQLQGNEIIVNPRKFPPAFPCSIKIGETVFFEYVLLRTQEILDDGTYIITNKEQNLNFIFEVRINFDTHNRPDFTITMNNAGNSEILQYMKFMKTLLEERYIHIYILSEEKDLIAGYIDNVKYKGCFASIDYEIDFLERVCEIEKYFNIVFKIGSRISEKECNDVFYISELIRKDEVVNECNEMNFNMVLDGELRQKILESTAGLFMLSYVSTYNIELFGATFEFMLMRSLNSAYIDDYEKVKKKVAILDDGDSIKITFKANNDGCIVDSLKIPEEIDQ